MNTINLKQKWDKPSNALPILFIGAGGIIRNAHIPAYNKLGLDIDGVYDLNNENAKTLAKDYNLKNIYKFKATIEVIKFKGFFTVHILSNPTKLLTGHL